MDFWDSCIWLVFLEAIDELWNRKDGCHIFHAVMSLERVKQITIILRFDDKDTRTTRHAKQPVIFGTNGFKNYLGALYHTKTWTITKKQYTSLRTICSYNMLENMSSHK